jgi:hypothetical protein
VCYAFGESSAASSLAQPIPFVLGQVLLGVFVFQKLPFFGDCFTSAHWLFPSLELKSLDKGMKTENKL